MDGDDDDDNVQNGKLLGITCCKNNNNNKSNFKSALDLYLIYICASNSIQGA